MPQVVAPAREVVVPIPLDPERDPGIGTATEHKSSRMTQRATAFVLSVITAVSMGYAQAKERVFGAKSGPSKPAAAEAPYRPYTNKLFFDQNDYASTEELDSAAEWEALVFGHVENLYKGVIGDNLIRVPGLLPGGRTAFLVSDHLDENGNLQHNALVIVNRDGSLYSVVENDEFIPNRGDAYYWPTSTMIVANPDGSRTMYVPSSRIEHVNNGDDPLFQFMQTGTDIAVFHIANDPNAVPDFVEMLETQSSYQPEVYPRPSINWWVSAVVGPDGNVYVDGAKDEEYGVRSAYMLRMKLADFQKHGPLGPGIEYWAGDGWSQNEEDAKPTIDGKKEPGLDTTWVTTPVNIEGKIHYIKVTKAGTFGEQVIMYISDKPEGPYNSKVLCDIPKVVYRDTNGREHPDRLTITYLPNLVGIVRDSRTGAIRLVITWSNNVGSATIHELRTNSTYWQQDFEEVDLVTTKNSQSAL